MAAFFATTTIEEVGKAVILGNRVLSGELDEKGFRNHRKKYACAVFETLSVNARVSRVYGGPEDKFATWFRDGELFDIRNSALYIEFGPDGVIVVPEQAVDKRDAYLLVCFGGDVFGRDPRRLRRHGAGGMETPYRRDRCLRKGERVTLGRERFVVRPLFFRLRTPGAYA